MLTAAASPARTAPRARPPRIARAHSPWRKLFRSLVSLSPEVRRPLGAVHAFFLGGCWGLYLNLVSCLVLLIRDVGGRAWTFALISAFLAGAGSLALLSHYVAAYHGAASPSVSLQA